MGFRVPTIRQLSDIVIFLNSTFWFFHSTLAYKLNVHRFNIHYTVHNDFTIRSLPVTFTSKCKLCFSHLARSTSTKMMMQWMTMKEERERRNEDKRKREEKQRQEERGETKT